MSKDDVSLEDELLQVTEKKNKNPPKKSKKDKHDDDEEEEGEYESNGDESDHKNNGKRKPKSDTTTKKPLKKRKTDDSSSDKDDSSDDEVYDDGWDEELMGDEEDRERLLALPEIEREAILDERYQKRKEMREGWEVRRRLKAEQRAQKGKEPSKESKRDTRDTKDRLSKRDRTAKKSDSKGKALSELKKRRAKAGYKKDDDSDFDDAEEGEVEEDDAKDDDFHAKKDASEDKEASKSSKEEEEELRGGSFEEVNEEENRDPITFSEVEQLRISRETMEKWMDKPFFDSLLPGFFVRIGIGMDPTTRLNVYRMAQVDTVESKTSYPFGGKTTTKWLRLLIGDKSKEFKMETVSNRPFTESEYKHWKLQMERSSRALPYSSEVPKKLQTLTAANNYQYTSNDIEKMLEEKKKLGVLPVKIAAEKAKLILERDAETDPDRKAELVERINKLDEQIKDRAEKKKTASSVLNINQRNRERNFIATLEAKVEERNANSDTDPFSRRRTIPTIVFASKYKVEDEPKPQNGTANPNKTPTPLKTSSGALPPGKASEHDVIDIDISISTPQSTLPFPPSRPQATPTPTTPPFVPPPEKEKEKKSTLSVSDYMERRRNAQE